MNVANLTIRLASADHPHNKEAAEMLIRRTTGLASFTHIQHHLSALNSNQSLEHLLWLAEIDGEYIGWSALTLSILENQDAAYLGVMPMALYIEENYRKRGIAQQLIETSSMDAVKLACKELMYQSFDEFWLYKGEDTEVISLELEFEQNHSADHELNNLFTRSFIKALERQVDDLPYFVQPETAVLI